VAQLEAGGPAGGEVADVLVFADIGLQLLLNASSGISRSPAYRPPVDALSDRQVVDFSSLSRAARCQPGPAIKLDKFGPARSGWGRPEPGCRTQGDGPLPRRC
jgi:hypothetical protein